MRFDPESCRECGAPFNNANPPSGGLCLECVADSLAAEAEAHMQLLDWEDTR